MAHTCNPSTGKSKDWRTPGAHWLARLAQVESPGPSERSRSQKEGRTFLRSDTRGCLLLSTHRNRAHSQTPPPPHLQQRITAILQSFVRNCRVSSKLAVSFSITPVMSREVRVRAACTWYHQCLDVGYSERCVEYLVLICDFLMMCDVYVFIVYMLSAQFL